MYVFSLTITISLVLDAMIPDPKRFAVRNLMKCI